MRARPDEQFYWIKKEDIDNTSFWVKEKAQNRIICTMIEN